MQTAISVEIDRPVDQVFEYTGDHVVEWSLTCVSDEVIEEKEGRVGTTFRLVTEERGKQMEFRGVVTRFDPPEQSAVFLEGPYFDIDVLYVFEDLGGRTRVTQHSVVHPRGFFKVVFFLLGWLMKRSGCEAQNAELESLKRHCEALPPRPEQS